jgi:DNA primase
MMRGRLQAEAGALGTAAAWAACLRMAARLPGESFANILLVTARQPGATMVRGYEAWREAGRQVSRGEQGIEIFSAPRSPAGSTRRQQEAEPAVPAWREATRVAYVWDIAQTSGPPAAARGALPAAPGEAPAGLCNGLRWLARREGYAVEQEQGAPADGVTFWTPRRIRVPPGPADAKTAWALAHQVGHVLAEGTSLHQPGQTTSGTACSGVRKAVADAVAFTIFTRYGIPAPHQPASPAAWAGTDPRAQPAAAILAAGERATAAAARIASHLDTILPGGAPAPGQAAEAAPARQQAPRQGEHEAVTARRPPVRPAEPPEPDERAVSILRDAGAFYVGLLDGSWTPAYLRSRGIGEDAARTWQIGCAPASWTTLTDHLRAAGYADEEIEAAGLARRSSRGTLIDHFRDRVMLPVRDPLGRIAGYTGRARPGSPAGVPRYINSPQTSLYRKGDLLFGLWETRQALASGAVPVITEGPFDAIAVTIAGAGRYAGLAPCGTALTDRQVILLRRSCNLTSTRVLVAFDDDPAGRKAAIRAFGLLRPATSALASARLAGRDPAQILQESGPQALREILTTATEPLLRVVTDAEIAQWDNRMGDTEGPIRAMRAAAGVLAGLLPASAARHLRQTTAGTELAAFDDQLRPAPLPRLPDIARALPADISREVVRLADRLGFTASDTLIEVANAVTRQAAGPGSRGQAAAARLAAAGFPDPPLETRPGEAPAVEPERPRRHSKVGSPRQQRLGDVQHEHLATPIVSTVGYGSPRRAAKTPRAYVLTGQLLPRVTGRLIGTTRNRSVLP